VQAGPVTRATSWEAVQAQVRADHRRLAECHGTDCRFTIASGNVEAAAANARKAAHQAFLAEPSLRGGL